MEEKIVELYTEADRQALAQRCRRWKRIMLSIGAAALAVCLALIALTNTANAPRQEMITVIVSTLAGWFVIYEYLFLLRPVQRELAHANMLCAEERRCICGEITVTAEKTAIRNSITARRVNAATADGQERLWVCDSRADTLAAADARVLYVCHGYVAAYGVTA